MAKVIRTDTNELIGYLDDPRCRGPLPKETRHVTFQGWRQNNFAPWKHEPTTPGGALLSATTFFAIQVADNAEPEITLFVRPDEVDFIKAHSSFRAVASTPV